MNKKTLSDKKFRCGGTKEVIRFAYKEEDVKEFIKRLKKEIYPIGESFPDTMSYLIRRIDKLAGSKLIEDGEGK